jgi:hypothetical protein
MLITSLPFPALTANRCSRIDGCDGDRVVAVARLDRAIDDTSAMSYCVTNAGRSPLPGRAPVPATSMLGSTEIVERAARQGDVDLVGAWFLRRRAP